MVYDFDVVCLQEARPCPNRPLVLQDFTVIQRHQGRGMAIVVPSNLGKTVSSLKSGSQAHVNCRAFESKIQIDKNTHSHQCIHTPLHLHHRASWNFLVETEYELGDTILICEDLASACNSYSCPMSRGYACALVTVVRSQAH